MVARSESGKTTSICNLIPKLIGKDGITKCFLFVSTAGWDPAYEYLKNWFEDNAVPYEVFEEIVSEEENPETGRVTKVNNLSDIITDLLKEGRPDEEKSGDKKCPRYLFLLDDLSTELKNRAVSKLFKQGRHLEARIICSSQDVIDIGRLVQQLQYICIWSGQSEERLKYIHTHMGGFGMSLELFIALYKSITSEPFQFMFASRRGEIRRNFCDKIDLSKYKALN